MFGSITYNRAPFNRMEDAGAITWAGIARGEATGEAILNVTAHLGGTAAAVATGEATFNGEFHTEGKADAVANATAKQIRRRYMSSQADAIATGTAGGIYLVGNEFLEIGNFLPSGHDLEIDTERMTLMIDSQNAIYTLSDDSTFFTLEKGDQVSFAGSGTVTVTFLWKDRWLG